MIDIELTPALALYSGLLGLLVAALWLYTELSVRRPQRFLGKQFLWRCVYCRYTYLDEQAESLSRCPRCESLNAVGDGAAKEAGITSPVADEAGTARPVGGEACPDPESRRNPSRRKRPHQRRRGPRRRR